MVGLDFNPPWVEGIRNSVRLISHSLMRYGHEVHILTKGYNNQSENEFIEGMNYHRVFVGHLNDYHTSGGFTFLFKLPLKLMKVIRKEKIDIVHGHSVYPMFGIILGMVSMIIGVKSVFTLYSSIGGKDTINPPQRFIGILENLSKSTLLAKILPIFVNRIIVTSDKAERSLISIGVSRRKIEHIPVGIDLSLFKPLNDSDRVKSKLNIPLGRKMILFAGDVTPWKGIESFLRAMSIIYKKYQDITCIMMTKDTYKYERERREQLDNLVEEYGIREFTHFIGRYSDIKEIYGISDVIALPYISLVLFMDTPLCLLEAMAMSKPLVVSKVGSLKDVISNSENGLLVEPNNEHELADAIMKLLSDDNLCKCLGEKGRQYIETFHDIDIVSKDIERLYSELLNGGTKEWKR
jgi:glycosyltransferase involved in cell wall biosynthesis